MSHLFISLVVLLTSISYAKERIIYGVDNRVETIESSKKHQLWANSTAGMIDTLKIIDIGNHYILPPSSLGRTMGLCQDERFKDQPNPLSCSGFLIGPNLLVTAGHCIQTQKDCNHAAWVFDFKVDPKNSKAKIAVEKKNVFKCHKLIEAKLEGKGLTKRDYSLVRLDRVVPKRKSLKLRTKGIISKGESLVLIGHPSGLPQKVTTQGRVFENESKHYFETNLDSFGGNSGSAVFNAKTGIVEGILVRGAKDYVPDSCGNRVNVVEEDITDKKSLGESVTRITDIDAIKKRRDFLQLVRNGAFLKVKALIKENKRIRDFLTDPVLESGDSVLHEAVKSKNISLLAWLISEGHDVDARNKKGETPLHVAAFFNNRKAVKVLLDSGADILVKDQFGVYPSERTNYFSIRFRNYLRTLQSTEEEKRKK